MRDIVIDFESYYDDQLSVKRQGAHNYLAQSDVYLVAIVGDDGCEWVGLPEEVDWTQFAGDRVWAHNLSFDGAYFPVYGLPLPGAQQNCSANLAAWLGAPRALDKAARMLLPDAPAVSKDVRKSMKGRRWCDLSADEQEIVKAYALNDARMACQLVTRYASGWLPDEQQLSAHTCAMGWEGIGIDRDKLRRYLARLAEIQATALKEIPWAQEREEAPLSLVQAREHCVRAGIEPPASFAEKNESYQLWEAMHRARVPWIAHLSRYRKATLLLARLQAMERRMWRPTGRLAYALKYFGAHTGRWSGGDTGLNLQNLRKMDFHGVRLRSLLIPAPGKKLMAVDLAQIEPRVLHWLCGDEETLALIRVGGFTFYEAQAKAWRLWDGSPGTLKATNPELYRTIKALSLGAGYGMGPRRFRAVVAEQLGIVMTLEEARRQLNDYRRRNPRVVAYWNRLDRQLQMSVGAGEMHIELPNCRHLAYRNLVRRYGDVYATFASPDGYRESKLWGGFLTENVVSAIARDVFSEGLLRLIRAGLKVVLHCHDEYVLEVDHDVRKEDVEELLRQPPSWAADLPIDVESWEGESYAGVNA